MQFQFAQLSRDPLALLHLFIFFLPLLLDSACANDATLMIIIILNKRRRDKINSDFRYIVLYTYIQQASFSSVNVHFNL